MKRILLIIVCLSFLVGCAAPFRQLSNWSAEERRETLETIKDDAEKLRQDWPCIYGLLDETLDDRHRSPALNDAFEKLNAYAAQDSLTDEEKCRFNAIVVREAWFVVIHVLAQYMPNIADALPIYF